MRKWLPMNQRKIHEGISYKYQCAECGKELSSKGHLYRQQKSQHEGVRYECKICGAQFTSKEYINNQYMNA